MTVSHDPALIEKVAEIIASNELGYSISLVRLVNGIETWEVILEGQKTEFGWREDAAAFVASERRKRQASRVIDAVIQDIFTADDDQDARQAVEGGADAAPEFDFAAQSAATDGGLSAEVVRTLRTPGPATGFAEKADDNG